MLNLFEQKPESKGTEVRITNFMMGSDPEFLRVREGTLTPVDASSSFRHCSCGATYADNCNCETGRLETPFGQMGLDGHSYIWEARPHPSRTPWGLVNNIGGILNMTVAVDSAHDVLCSPQAGDRCMGGHIHFGTQSAQDDLQRNRDYQYLSRGSVGVCTCGWCAREEDTVEVAVSERIKFMCYALMPVIGFLEGPSGWRRRWEMSRNGRYGQPQGGDTHRLNHHGFEFRTPGNFCSTPTRAMVTLCMARGAFKLSQDLTFVNDILRKGQAHGSLDNLYQNWCGHQPGEATERAIRKITTLLDEVWTPRWNLLNGAEILSYLYVRDRVAMDRPFDVLGGKAYTARKCWKNFDSAVKTFVKMANDMDRQIFLAARKHKVGVCPDVIRHPMGGLIQ